MERLDIGHMPVHTQVVQGVVEIQAEEFVLVLTGEGDAVIAHSRARSRRKLPLVP